MLIEIPDDLARRAKAELEFSADVYRQIAEDRERSGFYFDAAENLMLAAIVEADLSEPIQVGHLAHWPARQINVCVLSLDGKAAWVRHPDGLHFTTYADELTYAGPKPEGWGEQ